MRSVMSFSVICVWLFLAAISAPTTVCGEPVKDSSGNPLQQGVPYFILPERPPSLRGVIPLSAPPCPPDVAQSPSPANRGYRVYFTSSRQGVIQTNERIRIKFGPGDWNCTDSKIWRVRLRPELRRFVVSTGGSSTQQSSQFAIRVEGRGYKIVHLLGSSDKFSNVGIFTDNANVRRLILSEKPLGVRFARARGDTEDVEETITDNLEETMIDDVEEIMLKTVTE